MNYTAAASAAPDDNVFYDSKRERERGKGYCTLQQIWDMQIFICNKTKA